MKEFIQAFFSKGAFKERAESLHKANESFDWVICRQHVIPDSQEEISSILEEWCDSKEDDSKIPHVIFTMGGTGFAVRLF